MPFKARLYCILYFVLLMTILYKNIWKLFVCNLHYFQVLGYICMCLYGLTALIGYRRWNIQYKLFKRQRLLEEEQDLEI